MQENGITRQGTRWRQIIFRTTWHLLRNRRRKNICTHIRHIRQENGITHQGTRWRRIIFRTTWHLLRNCRRKSIYTHICRIRQEKAILAKELVGVE